MPETMLHKLLLHALLLVAHGQTGAVSPQKQGLPGVSPKKKLSSDAIELGKLRRSLYSASCVPGSKYLETMMCKGFMIGNELKAITDPEQKKAKSAEYRKAHEEALKSKTPEQRKMDSKANNEAVKEMYKAYCASETQKDPAVCTSPLLKKVYDK